MNTPLHAFILDLDDTLIDTQKVKNAFEENFYKIAGENQDKSILWQTYELTKTQKGFADYKYMANILSQKLNIEYKKALDIFLLVSFKNCLIPKTLELIEYLQTSGKVIIFSQGELQFQSQKINKTGIEAAVGKDNIIIIKQKKEHVAQIIQDLKNQGFTNLTFIDDRAEILDQAYSIDKNIQCFWVRYGKYKNHFPQTSCLTFQSESLEEIYKHIYNDNTVNVIPSNVDRVSPKALAVAQGSSQQSSVDKDSSASVGMTMDNFKIKLGITPNQVKQLITFTHQDKDIQNFTSDLKRFSNKESFKNWLSQGKYIYSLVDTRDNLLGIIWFNEKDPPKEQYLQNIDQYKITLGIRIYKNARGKGLGKKLFATALKHFKSTPEYKSINKNGFWSVISSENIPSQKLHKNIGFVQVTKPNSSGKIVMVYNKIMKHFNNLSVIILAGGKGKRMNAKKFNKVTYEVAGKPIITRILEKLTAANLEDIIVVVGHAKNSVTSLLPQTVKIAHQTRRLGTGHATKSAINKIPATSQNVLVLYGDDAFWYNPENFQELINLHQNTNADVAFCTTEVKNPTGLGRILRNTKNEVIGIVEEKNATEKQRQIKEINLGGFVFKKDFLTKNVGKLPKNELTGEYYLTDMITAAVKQGKKIETLNLKNFTWRGINTPDELKAAEQLLN